MLLIEDMLDVVIFLVSRSIDDISSAKSYIICQLKQVIIKKDDIELHTFGVSPYKSTIYLVEGEGEEDYMYIIRLKHIDILFKDINLANEYFNKILFHFFPDIKKLEVKDYFKI